MIIHNLTDKNIPKNELINSVDTSYYIIKELFKSRYGKESFLYYIRMKCDNSTINWSSSESFLWDFADRKMGLDKICLIRDYKELHSNNHANKIDG